MSLALIEESAKEVRRLAIAGSPLAVGDFRLKKLATPLEQAGAKVPVFAQVAKAINDLVNGTEAESASRLLNLSTLLNAILYTQGQSGAEGDFRGLESYATNCSSTKSTARTLKPLVEALTASGGGRLEVVKTAVERGVFNDLRLIDPAIQALGDNYPEIADLVAAKVLPVYGPGILPRLRAMLDLKGKKSDARKLTVIHELDPAGALELCKTALDDGSPDVKVAAIACLGKHEDCLTLVIEQANARNKQLRATALEALAEHDRPEVTKLFVELIQGKALDLLAKPFRAMRNKQVLASLLEEGRRVFGLLVKGDSEQIPRFCEILDCLHSKKDLEVEEFLLECFAKSDALAKIKAPKNSTTTGSDIAARLVALLDNVGSPKSFETILARHESLPAGAFAHVWHSALQTWPMEKVYAQFSPLLAETKGAGKQKAEDLRRFIGAGDIVYGFEQLEDEAAIKNRALLDPRWLDAAVKADQHTVVCALARPNHKAAVEYLLKLGEGKKPFVMGITIRALARCQYPKITDYFLGLVAKKTKGMPNFDYELQLLFGSAKHLPATDLPALDAFATKLDELFVDRFLEAIAPLRTVNPTSA